MRAIRLTYSILIFLISLNLSGQVILIDNSTLLDSLVIEIARENTITGSAVGYAGETPEQWIRFEKLKEIASNKDLIELTDHKNGTVRCYAFHALCLRNDSACYSILLKHLTDNEYVYTFFGCIQDGEPAGDYFFRCCYLGFNENSFKLSDKQIEIVDSILIFNPDVKLYRKIEILKTLKPTEKYYNRIREIVTVENNTSAIVALARFQNPQDIGLIMDYLNNDKKYQYWGIYAVREFPDSTFYNKLVEIFEFNWQKTHCDYPKWRILYQALAKYPNDMTIELFERTVKKKRGFRYQTLGKYLLIAIDKYPDDKYDMIREKIKLDTYYLDGYNQEFDIEN